MRNCNNDLRGRGGLIYNLNFNRVSLFEKREYVLMYLLM